MQETWVCSLRGEDPREKGMATHCTILAWRIPWTEEPGWLQSMGSQRATSLSFTLQLHALQHSRLPCLSLSPRSLLELVSIESVMPSNHLILCRLLLSQRMLTYRPKMEATNSKKQYRIKSLGLFRNSGIRTIIEESTQEINTMRYE